MSASVQPISWMEWAQLLTPILVAFAASAFGFAVYRDQKRVDRHQELLQRRREVYINFVSGLVDAAKGDNERHLRARIDTLMVGSDSVVKALKRYNDVAEATNGRVSTNSGEFKNALAEVVLAMREDVFEKSEISAQEFKDLLPVKR